MACGCNKNKGVSRSGPVIRPGVYSRSVKGGIAAAPSPSALRAQAVPPPQEVNKGGMTAAKRKMQAVRRDAIRRALGKP